MVDVSQLKKAEQALKEKYNEYLLGKKKLDKEREKYLVDRNELEEKEAKLNTREEVFVKNEEIFEDKKEKYLEEAKKEFEKYAKTKEKDIEAEEERLEKLNASLKEDKDDIQRQREDFGKEKEVFAQEKEKKEAKFLEGATKNIADLEKNEEREEKIIVWLSETGFYRDSIDGGLKKLRKELNEIAQKEKTLKDINDEIAALNKEVEETKSALSIRNRKEKLAQSNPEIPNHNFKDEKELVEHIKKYIASKGFYYEEGIVENFYTSLKAGYLVILSGISGVGKSKLPKLFAEAIGAGFEMIPVRPDWNDDRDLLGFFNISTKQYQTTRFIEFLIKANEDQGRLYIACLDEMNLAPVEYYFAQLLSQMESDKPELNPPDEMFTEKLLEQIQGEIELEMLRQNKSLEQEKDDVSRKIMGERIRQLKESSSSLGSYQNIPIPSNVKFVGTVNMDHTTHGFSDKVLDRANVIQFENVDISKKLPAEDKNFNAKGLSYKKFKKFCAPSKRMNGLEQKLGVYEKDLLKINDILSTSNFNIGFRVAKNINTYLRLALQGQYHYNNKHDKKIFDDQIKQRVLPKIQGMKSNELGETLSKLRDFFKNNGLPSSLEKIAGEEQDGERSGGMIHQLEQKGYVNYWELK